MKEPSEQAKITIPKGTLRALEALAKKRNTTIGEVLRQAVNTEVYMDKQIERGYTILAQDPDSEEVWKVVFTHLDY